MKRWLVLPLLLAALHSSAAPVSLFDGQTLEGWESREPSLWKVEDGCLTGGGVPKIPHNDFLCTKRSFSNFVLKLKIKLTGDPATGLINSGVQIRTVRNATGHEVCGYQCDYGEPNWYAGIYDEGRRNKFIAPADMAVLHPAIKLWDWNDYEIRAEGNRIQTKINGVPGVDYKEMDPNIPQDGILGIQVHAGGNTRVQVKDVTIEELPATPDAPTWEKLGGVEGVRAKLASPKRAADAAPPAKRDISYNAVASAAKTPDEELATFKVPDGFEVQLVAAESEGIGKFVPLAFDQHGALWTTTAFEYPVDGNENPAAADALYASHAKDKVLIYDRDPKSPTGYASQPRVFMDGLAIPLGVLPYKNGCYVLHGHDIVFAEDTDGDGKADKTTVILTGFGVQDSHLFPHQFMRAPGGWIWMAQGAFNYGKVSRPGDEKNAVQFDQTRMAKFRPDGSGFDITSNGPCNIWGLVLNGEGEAFIQEANDFGYPVMLFHEYANYPGCSDRQWKSYAPEFPGTAPDFRMGGTGLSGLALTDKAGPFPEPWRDMMLVANPITNRIQAIKMHRDGPRWKLDAPQDFLVSADPWFRPVAITVGPDGCLYIVDWYNKIISHNEVPRNHPDRDKTRGRIWRVKAKAAKPFDVPDFTKLSGDELIVKLGGDSLAQSHLAWQALDDRQQEFYNSLPDKLAVIAKDTKQSAARRIQALWAANGVTLDGGRGLGKGMFALLDTKFEPVQKDTNRNLRRELVKLDQYCAYMGVEVAAWHEPLLTDPDPEVRAQVIRTLGTPFNRELRAHPEWQLDNYAPMLRALLAFAKAPLAAPLAPSTKNAKPIKVREAYDREFERYLVRMFLERQPDAVAKFLDSDSAKSLPIESRLLATLALEPKASAARVAKLLPQLQRAPGQEEVLRLAQFPDEPGVGEALRAVLSNPKTSAASLESLLTVKTRLDGAKLAPFLTDAATTLLASKDATALDLGVRLASGFTLRSTEPALVSLAQSGPQAPAALRALGELGSNQTELFAKLIETSSDPLLRDEALAALASSKAADAPQRVFALYPKLTTTQRKATLERLSATKPGAGAILAALEAGTLAKTDLDASILDRLQAVLGANDPTLAKLVDSLGALFRPVLALDGSDAAWSQTNVTLDGPCTIEAWVRLDPEKRKIGNADGIAGAPGQLDINFFGETARVYAFPPLADVVVAKKPITPGLWTHVAATRDDKGIWKLFIDGELSATGNKPAPHKIENLRLAWTSTNGGPRGALSEVRVWNRERTTDEIRAASDRSLPANTPGLVFTSTSGDWGKLQAGAKVIKTSDFPPILTPDEAATLDAKYAKNRALAEKPGDPANGKLVAALCQACHLMGPTGGNIGPNLSGVGAMGTEGILRNILQPNAAMENGYRIYRVELKSGNLIDALFVSEDKDAVVIRIPGSEDRRIAKKDIRDAKYLRRSLMPEGLLDTFSPEQVTDLFAYLKTLK
jgi:putative membrane-bound dehydrogenase-like protein